MAISASLPFLTSVLEVLRPSKSPHLIASTCGVICLSVISHNDLVKEPVRFLFIAIAAVVALILVVEFSFRDRNDIASNGSSEDKDQDELESQFKFSRSMGIGVSIIALLLAGILTSNGSPYSFYSAWAVSTIQLGTFMVYSAIRLKKEEVESHLKIFEISFIMFVILLGLVYCLSKTWTNQVSSDSPVVFLPVDGRFAFSSAVFFLLWLRYEIFWVRRMFQIVEIQVR